MQRPGAGDYQGDRANEGIIQSADDGFVDGIAHAKIIRIHDEQARIVRIAQNVVGACSCCRTRPFSGFDHEIIY
jgi:hypothetical protein